MKLETFFEKFNQFADAPDAVAKMRELILQLAVHGTVVDPLDGDEPVEKLLRRIWSDKSGGRKELLGVGKAQPFELPTHWRWVVLAEVAEFSIGKTPPRGESSYWYPEDHSWVSIADMKHYGTLTETKEKVSASAAHDVFRQRFAEPGSILMSFKLTIGKVVRAGIRCFHNEAIISLQPPEPELADYLFRFLPIFAKLQTSNNAIKGSTLNKGLLTLLPIALPPLAEQKRIVAKVDELMALCDRLEAQQQEQKTRHAALARASLARFTDTPTVANLPLLFHPSYAISPADLRNSILNLAVQGKLVPQDLKDEQFSNSPDIQLDGPFDLPKNWTWIRLADLQPEFQNGASSRGDKNGVPVIVIRLADVEKRRISLDDPRSIAIAINQTSKYRLEFGDTLITRVNGSADIVGTFIPVQKSLTAIYCDHFIRMRINQEWLFPAYTALVGDSQLVRDQIKSLFITTAGQKTVNQGHIRSLTIPLPPLAEQRRIIAKVDLLMGLADELETQTTSSRATAAKLISAIVAELTTKA